MKTPILGSSYVARSSNAADSRMVNLYPEAIPEGGKEAAFLTRCPGLRPIVEIIGGIGDGPIRGMHVFQNYLYVVAGYTLYRVSRAFQVNVIGDVSISNQPVSMADNGIQLFIACNPKGYIYTFESQELKQIDSDYFPGATTVGYIGGYFVYNEPNSARVWVSDILDGSEVDPLDFQSSETSTDNVKSIFVAYQEVWIFGSNSTEVWRLSPNPNAEDFPLVRYAGAENEVGCLASYSVAKVDNTVFWLAGDARGKGMVYRASQVSQPERISTHAVEWQIQQYARLDDAIAYTYQQEGHSFYVLTFPTANRTWVYDAATRLWHERACWDIKQGEFYRHRSNNHAFFSDLNIVGDFENNWLYALDLEYHFDGISDAPQRWLRSWRALPTGENNLTRSAHHSLQLDCEVGDKPTRGVTPVVLRYPRGDAVGNFTAGITYGEMDFFNELVFTSKPYRYIYDRLQTVESVGNFSAGIVLGEQFNRIFTTYENYAPEAIGNFTAGIVLGELGPPPPIPPIYTDYENYAPEAVGNFTAGIVTSLVNKMYNYENYAPEAVGNFTAGIVLGELETL